MPILSKSPLLYLFTLVLLVKGLLFSPALAFTQTLPFSVRTSSSQEYSDTLRALIVFTRFKNDNYPGDPNVFNRQWPLNLEKDQLPSFAQAILAKENKLPFPDSSLTQYFYQQSLGNFVLFGQAYDSVLVSQFEESHYHKPTGSYGDLTRELLDRIDSYGFDFSKFDYNRDGFLDYVFIVVRGDSKRDTKRFVWTGASCLDGRCTGSMVSGKQTSPPVHDGITVDWNRSGSYIMHRTPGNVSPFHYYIRLMAHEIGHDLWNNHFVHVPQHRRNDVPLSHNRAKSRDCVAYVLMAGAGGAWDCGGSETISAYERDLLGWINCTELKSPQKRILVGDLYTTSSCYKIPLSPSNKTLYLSNLQRSGYFDQERYAGTKKQFQIGLRTTGLLVHLVQNKGVDVIPADNNLALSTHNTAYYGDLFGPETMRQLTPWTRPNSNGFTNYPPSFNPDWLALDDIRNSKEVSNSLVFDFYSDFRVKPVIREDSWIGQESTGIQITGPFVIKDESVVHLDTEITVAGPLVLDYFSTLHINPNATLTIPHNSTLQIKRGSTIHVAGTLHLEGILSISPGSELVVHEGGKIVSSLRE